MRQLYSMMLLVAAFLLTATGVTAQVVTTSPAIVQTNSTDIVITFHADRGSKGLMNQPKTAEIYAHTGLITTESSSSGDWKYVTAAWGTNLPKNKLTWVADNTWTLTIPSISSFYGITDVSTVKKLAFVFRNASGSLTGKGDGDSDIFVDVAAAGFQLSVSSSAQGGIVYTADPVTFTATATAAADIKMYVGSTASAPVKSASGVTTMTADYSFATPGDYKVIFTATTASGASATEELDITRVNQTADQPYPGGTPVAGPVAGANGKVTFCIPTDARTQSVMLLGSWNGFAVTPGCVMNRQTVGSAAYFWLTVDGIDPTADNLYYFLIDGSVKVGDPYARLVLDPWNDQYIPSSVFPNLPAYPSDKVSGVPLAIYNPSRDAYNYQVKNFRGVAQSDLIIYELLIRDFSGTEGAARAEGTVAGVIDRLDYIKSLGVNAVELLPIMEFNGNISWGYNTNFYFAPDKAYGTPADYRRLIDECHKRGMAVILDIVFNQSDGLHPWYQMYPMASNPFYNGSAPHSYSVLNDWNQDNDLVQKQWADALVYWLDEYKVDGFRFDLVKGLGSNASYDCTYYPATNTFASPSEYNTNRYNASRVARMKALHDAMRATRPDAYFINENLAGAQEENDMAADGEINWANINEASCQFAMGYDSNSSLDRFYAPLDSRTWGSTVSYAESHDEERMAYKQAQWGASGVKGNTAMSMRRLGSVAAQMILTPGAHMIWQFQEFGADQTTKNSGGNNTDPKTVIWSYLDNPDRDGLRQSYTELCGIRANSPELFRQDATTSVNLGGWDMGRTLSVKAGGKELYLFVNPRTEFSLTMTTPVDLASAGYHLVSASYGVEPALISGTITLPAGAYAVYATTNVSGLDEVIYEPSLTDSQAPVEYFNLQGVRVENPGHGIFIRRQGSSAIKIKK